jgi:rod shape determining protein RodA
LKNLDYTLILAAIAIIALGLVTIASATQATSVSGEANFVFIWKQLLGIALGTSAFVFFLFWRYEELAKYVKVLYGANLAVLLAVLLVGHSAGGAQRWVQIGPFLFQPSEFAKLVVIIGLAFFLSQREGRLDRFRDLLPALAYVGVPALLILAQPDLGTAVVFIAVTVGMLYIAGARPLWLGTLALGGLGSMVVWIWAHLNHGIWIPLKDYQIGRLTIFLDPWSDWQGAGYHMIQSQIAIGSGGLWGRGLFSGSQNQLHFLPEQHTDFIFSVLAEELGFIGVVILLSLFFILIYRGVRIAAQAKDQFGTLLATGIVSMLTFHVLTNVGMATGIMPVTGLPLPLFSYGPSSMVATLTALGLLGNVWLRRQMIVF